MIKKTPILVLGMLGVVLAGCSNGVSRQDVGTAVGAGAGGLVGSAVSGGSTAGTIVGAAAGAVIGRHVAKSSE